MGDRAWKAAPQKKPPTFVIGILAATCVGFFVSWVPQTAGPWANIAAFVGLGPKFWTLFTYPLVDVISGIGNFISFCLAMWWLWMCGTVVERRTGPLGLVALWFGSAAAMALVGGLVNLVTKFPSFLMGCYPPLAALTVVWGGLNPEGQLSVYGVIPIKGKWVAAISAGAVLFGYGRGNPLFGVGLCVPLLFLWFYSRGAVPGIPFAVNPFVAKRIKKNENRQFHSFIDDVRTREKDREERERLRRLFESSLDEPDDKR